MESTLTKGAPAAHGSDEIFTFQPVQGIFYRGPADVQDIGHSLFRDHISLTDVAGQDLLFQVSISLICQGTASDFAKLIRNGFHRQAFFSQLTRSRGVFPSSMCSRFSRARSFSARKDSTEM